MRVKLSLLSPFPASKLLVPVPPEVKTIKHLKRHLVKSLSTVASVAQHGRDLLLKVDGFELLSGSGMDMLEAGDVISVELVRGSSLSAAAPPDIRSTASIEPTRKRSAGPASRTQSPSVSKKPRRSSPQRLPSTPQRPSHPDPVPVSEASAVKTSRTLETDASSGSTSSPSSSSESSSSASSSSVDSSDSSGSSSSSDGESDSDSDSEAQSRATSLRSSPMQLPSSSRTAVPRQAVPAPAQPPLHPAPPGQGKPETKSRNARRTIARQMRNLEARGRALSTAASVPPSTEPETPSGSSLPDITTTTFTVPGLPVPLEMANGNKKKGFLKEMLAVQGTKTVFADASTNDAQPLTAAPRVPTSAVPPEPLAAPSAETEAFPPSALNLTPPRPSRQTRMLAPSEQLDLPSNVFVTSQVYEWRRDQGRRKKGGKASQQRSTAAAAPAAPDEGEDMELDDQESSVLPVPASSTTESTSRPEPETEAGSSDDPWMQSESQWLAAEEAFLKGGSARGSFVPAAPEDVRPGDTVAWQELELNQFTFTPELRLHMAKVIVPGENDLLVHQYSRPVEQQEAYAPGDDARADIFDLDWAEIVSADGRRKLRFYRS